MTLVSLRQLTNASDAPAFDAARSSKARMFAEDWNAIRDAIQNGVTGIRTKDLEVVSALTVGGSATVTGSLSGSSSGTVSGPLTVSGASTLGTLGVTGGATVGGDLTVSGDMVISGALTLGSSGGNVTSSDHVHAGTDGTAKIPLDSIVGVTSGKAWTDHDHSGDGSGALALASITGASGAWVAHDHNTDGSAAIPTGGIADGAITYAKIAPAAIGTGSSQLLAGDSIGTVITNIESFFAEDGTLLFLAPQDFDDIIAPGTIAPPLTYYGENGGGVTNTGLICRELIYTSPLAATAMGASFLLPGDSPTYSTLKFVVYWASPDDMSGVDANFIVTVANYPALGGTIVNNDTMSDFTLNESNSGSINAIRKTTVIFPSPLTIQPGDLVGLRVDVGSIDRTFHGHLYFLGIGISLEDLSL